MRVYKKRPDLKKGYCKYKKYPGRRQAEKEAKILEGSGNRPYLRKIGKIGDKLPYEIWAINRKTLF